MKNIIMLFLLISSLSVSAQKKKSDPRAIASFNGSISPGFKNDTSISLGYSSSTFLSLSSYKIEPVKFIFSDHESAKEIMSLNLKKDGKNIGLQADWDVMELHMDKKSFRWLNDSTAIYIKPTGKLKQ